MLRSAVKLHRSCVWTLVGRAFSARSKMSRVVGATSAASIRVRRPPHALFGSELGHRPSVAFYPARAVARLPETVCVSTEHVSGGTFFVAVLVARTHHETVRTARVSGAAKVVPLRDFHNCAIRHHAGRRIPPQRDEEFAR